MQIQKNVLDFFSKYIFTELGIEYTEANAFQLETRLSDVAKQLDFPDVQALYNAARLSISPQMKLLILDVATNNETLFFRDPPVFSAIESIILGDELLANRSSKPLRVWSAACSTGQEVYSLAMLFEDKAQRLPQNRYDILATDVSERVLRQAEAGRFTQLQVQRGLSAGLLVKNFNRIDTAEGHTEWHIKPEFKKHVSFRKLNLLDSFHGMGPFDLIMCRNVLIYQSPEGKRRVIDKMYDVLEDQGYLVLGAAESLIGLSTQFDMVRTEKATIYRKMSQKRLAG